jgi:hypothetical protein
MAVTHKLIETVTVTASGGAASIVFNSIPQTYTDLKVLLSLQNPSGSVDILGKFNTATTNFTARYLYGSGSSALSGNGTSGYFGHVSTSANIFGNTAIYIPNYTSSTNKLYSSDSVGEANGVTSYLFFVAGLWSNTSAITSMEFYPNANLWGQYSSASLYGINNS